MDQRPQNDYLRVNKSGKYIRKSIFHQPNAVPQPPQPPPQVYIINKEDFKSIVQQLTNSQPSERCLLQNPPKRRQKTKPVSINRTSSVPPSAMTVQEDPDVSLYMSYLQSLLEDSSESNEDQFQQSFDESHPSHMLTQAHLQPQVPINPMPQSNGLEQVTTPTNLPSSWFNGSPQQMHNSYSLQSASFEYPQPRTPNFTFPSLTQPEVLDLDQNDLERFYI